MAWWWSGKPWPGRGPFSHLPPWMRPGWLFGRGACRLLFWWLYPWYAYMTPWYLWYLYGMYYPWFTAPWITYMYYIPYFRWW